MSWSEFTVSEMFKKMPDNHLVGILQWGSKVRVESSTQELLRFLSPGSLNFRMVICAFVDKLLEGRKHLTHSYSFLSRWPNT